MQQRVLERCMHQSTGLLREQLVLRIDPNRKDKRKFVKKKYTNPNCDPPWRLKLKKNLLIFVAHGKFNFHLPRIPAHQTLFTCAV
jgi:hypothetical protein